MMYDDSVLSVDILASQLLKSLSPFHLMKQAIGEPDFWQREFLEEMPKRGILLCSRQSGKSTVVAILALYEALYKAPADILIIAPRQAQAFELLRKVRKALSIWEETGGKQILFESALRMELNNGSRILALPGKEESIRGYSIKLLILDEAARIPDDLYRAVRPMIGASNGKLIALSSAFGKRGWFWNTWIADKDELGEDWHKTLITADDCPRLTETFLASERTVLGDWWYRQEYMCEFLGDTTQLITLEMIELAVTKDYNSMALSI